MSLEEIQNQIPFGNMELFGLSGHNLMYAIGGVIFVLIFLYFGLRSRGKKIMKMTRPDYFDAVIRRELNNAVKDGQTLVNYIDAGWRSSLKSSHYYIGITETNLILIKVKGYMGQFTDTKKNKVVVNCPFEDVQDLKIKESDHSEKSGGYYVTWDVKKISFKAGGKRYKLTVKYGGVHEDNDQLELIAETLLENAGN